MTTTAPMDYQTFTTQQHPSFGGPFPTLPGTPAHNHHHAGPFVTQPSPSPQQQQQLLHHQTPQHQQHQAYPDARFLQSSPSPFQYGQQFPNGTPAAAFTQMGGGVPPTGGLMQPGGLPQNQLHQARVALQQQHQQHQHQQLNHQPQPSPIPFSTASFSQPIASPVNPQFVPNRQTASPSSATHHQSPYGSQTPVQHSPIALPANGQLSMPPQPQPQPQQPQLQLQQPQPSQPQVQVPQAMTAQPQAQTPIKAQPASPLSPVAQAREKERIQTLLDINMILLREITDLVSQGKGGVVGGSQDSQQAGEKPAQSPSKEYTDYMRRLQVNLAFLAQTAERKLTMPGPAIMTPPNSPDELVKLYLKLQGLFPSWKGAPVQQMMKASPAPGQQQQQAQMNQAQQQQGQMNPSQQQQQGQMNQQQPQQQQPLQQQMMKAEPGQQMMKPEPGTQQQQQQQIPPQQQ
ncbi:uncharacterized protein EI97DRAFT_462900 [Westerdykella ornata]|uniref:Uncharacterized protein n=1 Tax=Westerdykella ornata TaxID=318751 RepID=A0A6A6J550_WESOR|nr:uncharacterized protein EI97DRAFT_462900 [Westerdykella ornata]KAF2271364.1 hypothetical protein EI97DRAFT_462900 [Westerdykella ornata]